VKGGRERMYGKEYVKGKKKKNILFKRSMWKKKKKREGALYLL
jgi:hypothetical protein